MSSESPGQDVTCAQVHHGTCSSLVVMELLTSTLLPPAVPWAPHCHPPPQPWALGPVLPTLLLYLATWGPVPPTGFCTQLPQRRSLTLCSKGWEDRAQVPCPLLCCDFLLCLLRPPRCPPVPMPQTPPSSPFDHPRACPRGNLYTQGTEK